MKRVLVATVAVGASVFAIFLAQPGTVQEQADFLADGGFAPNRNATCPVRLDADVAAAAGVASNLTVTFPVSRRVLPDGGIDITLPPMSKGVRQALEVPDWTECTLAASTAPVRALWGTQRPFTRVGVVGKWCRAKFDAGLPCVGLDGGTMGDRNVSLCAVRASPATCERVSAGHIYSGEDPEKDVQ